MNAPFVDDVAVMRRAIELAARGLGSVEPNPPVGAVIVDEHRNLIGEGFHERFGGPHAEVQALRVAGERARGASMFVSLEPCAHHGKTPPCSQAVIAAGIRRVVVAMRDPAPHASGRGLTELREAGIEVETGLCEHEAAVVASGFLKWILTGWPLVHAKWAMTLDGKIASRTGHSQWISGERSREIVHELRGRMDAILVGAGTAQKDDPLLTARASRKRIATRIVLDRDLQLPLDGRLLKTLDEAPVLIATSVEAAGQRGAEFQQAGAELISLPWSDADSRKLDLKVLFNLLGERQMSHLLVEGGGGLLGNLFDQQLVDACHVFVAPKLVGGADATSPFEGRGLETIPDQRQFVDYRIEPVGDDIYIQGLLSHRWWEGRCQ